MPDCEIKCFNCVSFGCASDDVSFTAWDWCAKGLPAFRKPESANCLGFVDDTLEVPNA